jgi:quercetin dioxygenase-like cupin family protein
MDNRVTDFFNANKDIKHNKDVLSIPAEFLNIESDQTVTNFFKWIRHSSQCKSLRLDIDADISEIKQELKTRASLAIPHREHPTWKSITLYGYSSIMTNSYEQYKLDGLITDEDVTDWTDVSRFFPKTVTWLKENCPLKEFARIRVMVLEPGGSSDPHKDYEMGQALCGPINVAVVNPPGSEFVLENGGIVPWQEGDVRSMDLGSVHCIRNLSNEPRIHLIITPAKTDWDIDAMRLACKSFIKYQRERDDTRRN